ncbi:MAG: cyclic nucleotide-binding domain-containing protein [Elusimicrobia bacterium]|nr:cyclic nucleotide-binding domain-containing protein [Elusimicrobiota bacterium]
MVKLPLGQVEMGVLARSLRGVDFFSPLTVGQLDQVLPYVALYGYEAGETVFRQGEAGDAFYIVHAGKVDVLVKAGFLSLRRRIARLGPGGFFGEIALISRSPRTATIRTAEPSRLFALVASDFQFVLKQNPSARAEMERIAARRRFGAKASETA